MYSRIAFLAPLLFAVSAQAQISPYQKTLDFQELVGLFDKDYAFIEWKNQLFGFDGLKLAPWLAQLNASQDDLSYFDAATLYTSSFQDSHTVYLTPSTFFATLGFTVDLYSGKVLIDSVDSTTLDPAVFPLKMGDELLSVDGRSVADWIALFTPFVNDASPVSRARSAAGWIVSRSQQTYPRATEIGATAEVVIKGQAGDVATYQIPWDVSGLPYQSPLLPDPTLPSLFREKTDAPSLPSYAQLRQKMRKSMARTPRYSIGVDDFTPFFNLPAGFTVHNGKGPFDSIYSGSFKTGGYTIAYIRIPDFLSSSSDVQAAVTYFTTKVPTDGLILDLMRNPGGFACEAEAIASSLSPNPLVSMQLRERVTFSDIFNLQQALSDAMQFGTQDDIDFFTRELAAYQAAYAQKRGFTDPLPLCGYSNQLSPATDVKGRPIAYTKPVMLLTDEMTASSAEILAAIMQDNHAAMIYGVRTNGAGGALDTFNTGSFTEGQVYMARSILLRNTSPAYLENQGVQPDMVSDYMTTDNLLNKGQTFVDGFTNAMVGYIKSKAK
jgi:C-terminal processing protease CtpA/Prc